MRLAAITAAAVTASLALPPVGAPLALGLGGYLALILSKPNQAVRGHTLSATQYQRAALIVCSAVFELAALLSATLAARELAGRLESQVCDRIELAAAAGAPRLGESMRRCEGFASARATIVRLATDKTLGSLNARLALDDLPASIGGPGERRRLGEPPPIQMTCRRRKTEAPTRRFGGNGTAPKSRRRGGGVFLTGQN